MPARSGNWQLLGHDTDPVAGDPDQLHDLISYYATIADTITSEADVLQRIGSGDATELKGKSADAIRSRSKDVAKSLNQTSGRYDAVSRALAGYGPALDTARTDSARVLQDAEAAEGSKGSSNAMPDPSAGRADDAPPLTDEENAQVHARTTAIADASEASGRAQRRMDEVLGALNSAGKAASSVIRGAWDDGLVDTWQYKLRQGFLKFLKVLVKVLMWIGVALAVLAFFVPGLGALALAGAAVAVVSLAASTVLAAMGEGSWLDVILGAVSVLLIGVGVIVSKAIALARTTTIAKSTSIGSKLGTPGASTIGTVGSKYSAAAAKFASERKFLFDQATSGKVPVKTAMDRIEVLDQRLRNIKTGAVDDVVEDVAVKPQFWQIRKPGYVKEDLDKIREFGSGYRFDRLFGMDGINRFKETQQIMWKQFGILPKPMPNFYYIQAGRGGIGVASNLFTLGKTPTGLGGDDVRIQALEDAKLDLTTAKP